MEFINLLNSYFYPRLADRPAALEDIVKSNDQTCLVVIDEVQKIPALLDEVHRLIEERGTRFLLTGSSAGKLRRGGVKLLAGRAWIANLFPLFARDSEFQS